ncbi:hypothetical protein G9A89_015260 [Geosiphon pyriformis]|nr:hypothetical protein G9A89_015260 [Geosiphon pyriformis]
MDYYSYNCTYHYKNYQPQKKSPTCFNCFSSCSRTTSRNKETKCVLKKCFKQSPEPNIFCSKPPKSFIHSFRNTLRTIRKRTTNFIHPNLKNTNESRNATLPYSADFWDSKIEPDDPLDYYYYLSTETTLYTNCSSSTNTLNDNEAKSKTESIVQMIHNNTSHLLPPLESVEIFYKGYPNEKLITEAADIINRIDRGGKVSHYERITIRNQLEAQICKRCSPGTAEFLSWQVFLDMWGRIPDQAGHNVGAVEWSILSAQQGGSIIPQEEEMQTQRASIILSSDHQPLPHFQHDVNRTSRDTRIGSRDSMNMVWEVFIFFNFPDCFIPYVLLCLVLLQSAMGRCVQ